MKPFFVPDDFNSNISKISAAEIANAKLTALIEAAPVVYRREYSEHWMRLSTVADKEQARLMFIEMIKKEPCKHEPELGRGDHLKYSDCKHCGVKLVAEWTEAK